MADLGGTHRRVEYQAGIVEATFQGGLWFMSGSAGTIDRLPFALPNFTRHSWVSDQARQIWEPRLNRICTAWPNVEWLSIIDGVRPCALVGLSPQVLSATIPQWSAHHLSALGLPMSPAETPPGIVLAVVGTLEDVTRARDAWVARADDALGRLLGYPDCCRKFFREVWVDQSSMDTTWAMAANTTAPKDAVITLESGHANLANILWRWMGVRAVPHLPCQFDCGESIQFGEQLLRVAERAGYTEEVEWIQEVLSWPVEWSALHGIAEIKTPILKISTRTDATASKYVVRWTGTGYPQEGATGLRFPYRAPTRQIMTEGRSFQLGFNQIVEPRAPERSWFYLDNKFSSLEAMSELHRPIVALARQKLNGLTGNVLDLGCGNGAPAREDLRRARRSYALRGGWQQPFAGACAHVTAEVCRKFPGGGSLQLRTLERWSTVRPYIAHGRQIARGREACRGPAVANTSSQVGRGPGLLLPWPGDTVIGVRSSRMGPFAGGSSP